MLNWYSTGDTVKSCRFFIRTKDEFAIGVPDHYEAFAGSGCERTGEYRVSVHWLAGPIPFGCLEPDQPRQFLVADSRRRGVFPGGVGPNLALAFPAASAQGDPAVEAISH